jgi:hypothetical protein
LWGRVGRWSRGKRINPHLLPEWQLCASATVGGSRGSRKKFEINKMSVFDSGMIAAKKKALSL